MSLEEVRQKIGEAKVTLVAVSKGRSVDEIRKVYDEGVRDFGENRVAEALEKMEMLPKDIRWHYIGKLQKNKVNKAIGKFALIHSVDSVELAEKLAQVGVREGVTTSILLETNTSGEASKSGLSPEEWKENFEKIKNLPALSIAGLMTMAPLTEDENVIRSTFSKLRVLKEELELKELSMGMSHDYEIALEEGATLLRIGSALFET